MDELLNFGNRTLVVCWELPQQPERRIYIIITQGVVKNIVINFNLTHLDTPYRARLGPRTLAPGPGWGGCWDAGSRGNGDGQSGFTSDTTWCPNSW